MILPNNLPDLGPEQLSQLYIKVQDLISKSCNAARSTIYASIEIKISYPDNITETIALDHIPPELVQAFHDMATRLIAHRFIIEDTISNHQTTEQCKPASQTAKDAHL